MQVDLSGVTLFTAAGVRRLVALYEGSRTRCRSSRPPVVLDVLAVCRVPMESRGPGRSAAIRGAGARFV